MACAVCLAEEFTDPVEVPCSGRHKFCRECLHGLRNFICPVCRAADDPVQTFLFRIAIPADASDEWKASALRSAISGHCEGIVRTLLAMGTPVVAAEISEDPLTIAAEVGALNVVPLLLAAGANLRRRCQFFGYTELVALA